MERCPLCGSAEIYSDTRDIAREYEGISTIFHDIQASYCDACGEAFLDMAESERYMQLVSQFKQKVNQK